MRNTSFSLLALVALAASSVYGSSFDVGSKAIGHAHRGARNLGGSHNGNVHHLHNGARRRDGATGKTTHCAAFRLQLQASISSSSVAATSTTSIKETPAATVQPPAPTKDTSDDKGSSSSGDTGSVWTKTYSGGDATFYTPGLNACGWVDKPNAMIAAIPYGLWNSWPGWDGSSNDHPLCKRMIEVEWQGKSTQVMISDLCGGCDNPDSTDLAPDAFKQLSTPDAGRIHGISWHFI